MIEINVRIKIDTNDPREAYLQAMSTLSFSGHIFEVSDYWLANGKPIPKCIAQSVKEPLNFIKDCGRAVEHDPGLQPLLDDLRGLPGEHGKSDAMKEWAEEHGVDYLSVAFVEPEEVTQCVSIDELPKPRRINVLPNAGGARDIDEEISNLFECIRNSSEPFRAVDFNVGEAEEREARISEYIVATDRKIRQFNLGSYFNVVVWKWIEPFGEPM